MAPTATALATAISRMAVSRLMSSGDHDSASRQPSARERQDNNGLSPLWAGLLAAVWLIVLFASAAFAHVGFEGYA